MGEKLRAVVGDGRGYSNARSDENVYDNLEGYQLV